MHFRSLGILTGPFDPSSPKLQSTSFGVMLTHTESAGLSGLVGPTDRDRDQLIFNLEASASSLQVTLSQGRTRRGPTHPPRGPRSLRSPSLLNNSEAAEAEL